MRKVKSLLFALALAIAFTISVRAGEIPAGIWCYSQECTEQNPAPQNCFWQEESPEAWQMYCSNCG